MKVERGAKNKPHWHIFGVFNPLPLTLAYPTRSSTSKNECPTSYIWKVYLNYTVCAMLLQIIRLYYSANCKVCPNIYRSICIPYLCILKRLYLCPFSQNSILKLKLKIHFLYYCTSNREFFQEIYLVGPTTLSEFKICYILNGLLLSKKFSYSPKIFLGIRCVANYKVEIQSS